MPHLSSAVSSSLPAPVTTPEQARELLTLPDAQLFASAARLRQAVFGDRISLCAIINARSGNCGMDCRFCSQSRHNQTPIATFPLLAADVLRQRILDLARWPVRHIGIVTSGGALQQEELEQVLDVLRRLPEAVRPRVCTSFGRLAPDALQTLARAGVRRFHHNLETSRSFYPQICTTQRWEQRYATAQHVRAAGLSVCTGGLFGLGESWEDRIELAFSLRELGVDSVPINFLHPHPQTPLGNRPPLTAGEALRIIALFRHILPDTTLRICGGRPETLGDRQSEIFHAGANALMTGDYLTTHGCAVEQDCAMIAAAGLEVTQP